jgi:F420-non-reducing hydrogenase large subunit
LSLLRITAHELLWASIRAAKGIIHGGKINDGLLNMVEMAFRAYDPCNACATHSLPGEMPLHICIHNEHGVLIQELKR